MFDDSTQNLNLASKRPRTLSTPTSDQELLFARPFSRDVSMVHEEKDEPNVSNAKPPPGVQYHDFKQAQPKTDIAQASAVPHYLVPYSWYQKFIAYVKDGFSDIPPPLDLGELDHFKDGDELRADLKHGKDIQLLQVEQWTLIQSWYGKEDEQCVRHSYKLNDGNYIVEYRPTEFYFSLYTPPSAFTEMKVISMYKYKDVEGLYEKVRHAFDIPPAHQVRFWHTTESSGLTNLTHAREAILKTYERVSIGAVTGGSTTLIVETRKNASEKWQLEGCKSAHVARSRPLGTKGLVNLGNTCYMASALQCLTHVKELSEYFLSGCYTSELNESNPLGYGGKVATAFAKLLKQLYLDDNQKAVAPRELKTILGSINQSFGGYQQQDSQELLAFLLDALHEDLNRIVKKPATERPDIGDVDDNELLKLGDDAWHLHKLRNDSVIVDLFQGIYKSTLVCPVCAHVSITFDPFSDLSLPLPFRSYWVHDLHYVPLSGGIVKLTVEFEQNASIGQIISYLAKRFHVKSTMIAGAEVWKHRFYKVYENYMPVTTIERSDDAYFYELDTPDPRLDKSSTNICIPVYTNKKARRQEKADECAIPFPIVLTESEAKSVEAIKKKLLQNYTRFTTSSDLVSSASLLVSDSALDHGLDLQQDPSGTSPMEEGARPFEIKVGPHKIGESFYGGREPRPLAERVHVLPHGPVHQVPLASTQGSPPTHDILPSYVTSTDAVDVSFDAIYQEEIMDPRKRSSSLSESARSPFEVIEHEPLSHGDIDMQDISDDELMRPSHYNRDLVERLVSAPTIDSTGFTITDMPTPMSIPTTPTDIPLMEETSTESALLSDADALYCEWSEHIYDEIFSEESDTIGGRSRWTDIEYQQDEEMDNRRATREGNKSNTKSLEDCLDEFAKEEPLDAENTWYCPKCKEHQRALKTFELWRTGDILIFHLKRFSSSRSLSDKIDAEIQFPIRGLNLNDRLGERRLKAQKGVSALEDSIYDLTGVVNHYGGLGGGHYTAFAQTFSADGYKDFHNFNDASVNPVDSGNLISSSAYLLFYRKRTNGPLSEPLHRKIEQYVADTTSESGGGLDGLDGIHALRETSLPRSQYDTPGSSPVTSSSGDSKPMPYVPFVGPGHQLGGVLDEANRPSAASNPFGGSAWASNALVKFATTNSETSERLDSHFPENEVEDSVSWSNSEKDT